MVLTIIFILLAIIIICLLTKFIKAKNYKVIIIMFAIIITIGLVYFIYTTSKNYKIIYSGYISDFDNMIISNFNDYNEFMADSNEINAKYKQKISSTKYNKKYFENKSLALIFIAIGNSSNILNKVDISTDGNILTIIPNTDDKNTPRDDITGKLILVEIDKNISKIELKY